MTTIFKSEADRNFESGESNDLPFHNGKVQPYTLARTKARPDAHFVTILRQEAPESVLRYFSLIVIPGCAGNPWKKMPFTSLNII